MYCTYRSPNFNATGPEQELKVESAQEAEEPRQDAWLLPLLLVLLQA